METTLAKITTVEHALSQAQTIPQVKEIRDQAETLRQYIKLAGQGLEMQNRIAEIKIRAERKAGEMLAEMIPASGGRPSKNLDNVAGFSPRPTLKELGISYHQSKRWRLEATVPEAIFNTYVTWVKTAGEELTSAGILRLAKQLQQRGTEIPLSSTNPWGTEAADRGNWLYRDEWLIIWDGATGPPFVIVDKTVTLQVFDGQDVIRSYVLEPTPGLNVRVEQSQMLIVLE